METMKWTEKDIPKAVTALQEGEVVAFPTETVYGLGAMAENEMAVKKVYEAKGRPSDNPLIVHVANQDMVARYTGPLSQRTKQLMEAFWPGALTLILPLHNHLLSQTVTGGLTTCAFRMPNHALTLELIAKTGPLVGPSANTSGRPSPTCAKHVEHDLHGKIAGILDGGSSSVGVESTVIDLSIEDKVTILRPGAITKEMLEAVIGPCVEYDQTILGEAGIPKAPGMKYTHYSPEVAVVMVHHNDFASALAHYQDNAVALLCTESIHETFPDYPYYSLGKGSIQEANEALFAGLRALDQYQYQLILAETMENIGQGRAYMNRLEKASGHQQFKQ